MNHPVRMPFRVRTLLVLALALTAPAVARAEDPAVGPTGLPVGVDVPVAEDTLIRVLDQYGARSMEVDAETTGPAANAPKCWPENGPEAP